MNENFVCILYLEGVSPGSCTSLQYFKGGKKHFHRAEQIRAVSKIHTIDKVNVKIKRTRGVTIYTILEETINKYIAGCSPEATDKCFMKVSGLHL